jgi:hypothetical protein
MAPLPTATTTLGRLGRLPAARGRCGRRGRAPEAAVGPDEVACGHRAPYDAHEVAAAVLRAPPASGARPHRAPARRVRPRLQLLELGALLALLGLDLGPKGFSARASNRTQVEVRKEDGRRFQAACHGFRWTAPNPRVPSRLEPQIHGLERQPAPRVISDCHFTVQLHHFTPGFLSYSVALFLFFSDNRIYPYTPHLGKRREHRAEGCARRRVGDRGEDVGAGGTWEPQGRPGTRTLAQRFGWNSRLD